MLFWLKTLVLSPISCWIKDNAATIRASNENKNALFRAWRNGGKRKRFATFFSPSLFLYANFTFQQACGKKTVTKTTDAHKKNQVEVTLSKKKSEKLLGKNYNVLKLTNGRSQVLQSFKITQTPHISSCNSSSKYSAFNNLLHKLSNYTLCTTILSLCAKNALAAFQTMLHNGLMWIVWLL